MKDSMKNQDVGPSHIIGAQDGGEVHVNWSQVFLIGTDDSNEALGLLQA